MASLLDERPKARGPILFGNALVRAQESDRKAREDERQAQIAEGREKRLSEAQRVAERQREMALELTEKMAVVRMRELSARIKEADATIKFKETEAALKEAAMDQFGKAAIAIGKLDPKANDYDLKLAEIKAANPNAFTFGDALTKSLDGIIEGKTKARDLYIKSTDEAFSAARKNAETLAAKTQAEQMGMKPVQATVDGFVFKKPEAPMVFGSFEEAQKANPNARITGTLDSAGKFIVNEVGTKSGTESVGSSLLPSEAVKPVSSEKPKLEDIFK